MLIDKLLPIVVYFFAGYLLKKQKVFKKTDGAIFLRAVLYLCLPPIAFATFSRLDLGFERIFPVLTALFIIIGNFLITRLYLGKLGLSAKSSTVLLLSTIILNTSLMLPFAQAKWGEEGTAIVLLFDISHVTMVFTFSYWAAMRYGNERSGKVPVAKILRIPPLWGIFGGIIANLAKIPVPQFIYEITDIASKALIIIMMTALGIFFEFRLKKWRFTLLALLQRSAGGLLLGWIATLILGVKGIDRTIMLLVCAAPVGFNTLVLTDLEDLDRDLAAELVTVSTLIAVILLPVVLLIL